MFLHMLSLVFMPSFAPSTNTRTRAKPLDSGHSRYGQAIKDRVIRAIARTDDGWNWQVLAYNYFKNNNNIFFIFSLFN